ncbi:hypothetical protein KBC04_03365 [Candidatus Babeliales bacterium]|nr:hypothetical protein [Candidatus Babeliales bacterium]MBP9843909.1 hypothetical protein [Candidatus Babeliales bacterium]
MKKQSVGFVLFGLIGLFVNLVASEEPSFVKDYVRAFRQIERDHTNASMHNYSSYLAQHPISCAAAKALVQKFKYDPCSQQILTWGDGDRMTELNYLRLYMPIFMQSHEEHDNSARLANEYNNVHGLSKSSNNYLHSFDNKLCKHMAFESQAFRDEWTDAHKKPADLIALYEKVNEDYKIYTKNLENLIAQRKR